MESVIEEGMNLIDLIACLSANDETRRGRR